MKLHRWLVTAATASLCAVAVGAGPAPASTSDPPPLQVHTVFVPPGFGASGDPVKFESTVANVGTDTLTDIGIAGSPAGASSCQAVSLDPGQSTVCTLTYVATQGDVDAGAVTETVTATGVDPLGAMVASDPSGDVAPGAGIAALALRIVVTPSRFEAVGDTVGFAYTVGNTGSITLHDLALADDRIAGSAIACPATTLAPGAAMTCTGSYTITPVDLHAALITDRATVNALDPHDAPVTSPTAAVTVPGPRRPSLRLLVSAGGHVRTAGDPVLVRYQVTNVGPSTVASITLSDARVAAKDMSCPATTLPPGRSMTCSGTLTATAQDIASGRIRDNAAAWGTEPLRGMVATAPTVSFVVPISRSSAGPRTVTPPPSASGTGSSGPRPASAHADHSHPRGHRREARCPGDTPPPAAGGRDRSQPSSSGRPAASARPQRRHPPRTLPSPSRRPQPAGQPGVVPRGRASNIRTDTTSGDSRSGSRAALEIPLPNRPATARAPPWVRRRAAGRG